MEGAPCISIKRLPHVSFPLKLAEMQRVFFGTDIFGNEGFKVDFLQEVTTTWFRHIKRHPNGIGSFSLPQNCQNINTRVLQLEKRKCSNDGGFVILALVSLPFL